MTHALPHAADVAVVIPTRNRWATLQLTLAALARQTVQGFETVVVVDGTDDGVPDLEGVRVVGQDHAGPAAARNRGVAETDRRLIVFLGDDMVPREDFLARHLARHVSDPRAEVAVLGRVVWHPAVPRDRLHRWLEWSGALFDFPGEGPTQDAGWGRFYSCNVSLKRELFEAAGGFDPDFTFDYEDLDLAWRLHERGMCLHHEPRAVTEHLHPYDWAAVTRRYESRAVAERLMMRKHDWFQPWFHDQMAAALREPTAGRVWTLAADGVPSRARSLRGRVRRRADRHYRQRLAPSFLAAWEQCAREERVSSIS